jgi:hypothetical protein
MGKTRDSANLVSDNNITVDIVNDRVGIGTTTPQFDLDVDGDINLTGTFRQNGSPFVASRWTSGNNNDIYRLNGNIGIATTNPQYTLDVIGDINFTGTFRQNGSQFVASRWSSGVNDDIYRLNGNIGIATTNPLNPLQVGSGTTIVIIDSLGDLGIGTATATSKLHVIGDARVSGVITATSFFGNGSGLTGLSAGLTISDNTSTNSTFYPSFTSSTSGIVTTVIVSSTKLTFNPSTGTLTATALAESSSIAFKENINPIENALDLLLQLNPVTYDRKDNSAKNEVGLIAEEVDKIIPNIISRDENGNPEGINYTKLSVYLIDAIKTLRKEIDNLKEK